MQDGQAPTIEGMSELRPLGSGGFATVWRAREQVIDREVAVKVLDVDGASDADREAFLRECRAMGAVSRHPNIVTVFSATWTDQGQPAIVMELFEQGTYEDRALRAGGRLGHAEVLETGVLLAGALQSAHDVGLVHRDLKPQNVFRSAYGQPALGDFGISVFADELVSSIAFSPHYAPPEVLDGVTNDPRSDVYSLGVTLYRLLAGRRPFEATSGIGQSNAEVYRRVFEEPPPAIGAGCPAPVERAVAAALAKDPRDRPPSAAALAERLRRAQVEVGLPPTSVLVVDVLRDADPSPSGLEAPPDRSATLARPVRTVAAPTPDTTPAPRPSVVRRAVVGAVVVGLLAVLAASALTRGDDAEPTPPDDVVVAPDDDAIFETVAPPQDVQVAAVDGGVEVTFDGGDGVRFDVVRQGGEADVVTTEDERAIVPVDPREVPCFAVRAYASNGRRSEASEVSCLPVTDG